MMPRVMSMVKTTVKTVLPESWAESVARGWHLVGLKMTPRQPLDASNLGPAIDLQVVLNEEAPSWLVDHAQIVDAYGAQERYGGVNPGDRRAIYQLIYALKPLQILEIGTHIGASTLYAAAALRANGSGSLTTVDILDVNGGRNPAWQKVGLPASPRDIAAGLGLTAVIDFVVGSARAFMRQADRFDFIFLDGDHRPSAVYRELSLALRLLEPGGHILLHDYHPPDDCLGSSVGHGPFLGVERARRECSAIGVQPLGNLPWRTHDGTTRTSLALLTRDG